MWLTFDRNTRLIGNTYTDDTSVMITLINTDDILPTEKGLAIEVKPLENKVCRQIDDYYLCIYMRQGSEIHTLKGNKQSLMELITWIEYQLEAKTDLVDVPFEYKRIKEDWLDIERKL